MFLNLLNDDQKDAFSKIALFIIHVNGIAEEREEMFYHSAMNEMGITDFPESPESMEEVLKLCKLFDTPIARNIILIECSGVAASEGTIDESEKELLEKICEELKLPARKLEDCCNFAFKALAILHEGEEIISSE